MASQVPLSHLIDVLADNVVECSVKVHESITKNRPADTYEYSQALSALTSAYEDLVHCEEE